MTNSVDKMIDEQEYFNGFVATNEVEEIVGYAAYYLSYYTWIGKSLYMDDIYVKAAYRGNGIGTKLIKEVINHAKVTKCRKVRWQVSEWNESANDFYKSLGATISSVESNCDLILEE